MTSLLILGGTGLVGSQVLKLALQSHKISKVYAPTRTAIDFQSLSGDTSKLNNPTIDFDDLPEDSPIWKVDAVICCLGTTLKKAGSKDAFRKVDYRYVLNCAKLAKHHGAHCFVLNSSMGARVDTGSFYLKVKGELEQSLRAYQFDRLILVRPSLLIGERVNDKRTGERIGIWLAQHLKWIIPKKWQAVDAASVASVLFEQATMEQPGTRAVESNEIIDAATRRLSDN